MKSPVTVFTVILASFFLSACGGDSTEDLASSLANGDNEFEIPDCIVLLNTVNLKNGLSCRLSEDDANLFGTTPGLVSCAGGQITYQGNQFQSGPSGVSFNGLTFVCN